MPGLERILLAACLAFAAAPACAAAWGVEDLMRELGAVESSQARFVERKYLRMLKAPLEQSGTLSYSRPGRLERRTLKPKPETLSVAGDTLVLESPARNERRVLNLRDYPVLWGFVESIRGTLGGDLPALERFYRVELEGARAQWRLDLVPRERSMSEVISLIRIAGSGARIHTVEVQEARGDRSVMKIEAQQP